MLLLLGNAGPSRYCVSQSGKSEKGLQRMCEKKINLMQAVMVILFMLNCWCMESELLCIAKSALTIPYMIQWLCSFISDKQVY